MTTQTAPLTRRVNRGGGHSYVLDGDSSIGVTKVLGEGFPKPALIGWAANETRDYAIDHWDELAEMSIAKRVKALSDARYANRDLAGKAGRAVHTIVEKLTAGAEVDVPDYLAGHVESYIRFVEEWRPVEQLAEAIVVNRRFGYMGTLDMIGALTAVGDETWLVDYKTTRSGVFDENALQIAGYRFCETYIGAGGIERPLPKVDRTAVLWIRADGYDLVPVEAGLDEFRVFLYALGIAKWRETNDVIGEALTAPAPGERG